MARCRIDFQFFVNAFCWLFEPRRADGRIIPFVSYGYQNDFFDRLGRSYGIRDVGLLKSRDLGATWMVLTFFFHRWLFERGTALGIMSRDADSVDKSGDPSCLFWKIDFLLRHLPSWMKPNYSRVSMRLANLDNESTIVGEQATGDAFRGGRCTAIMLDEFAAFRKGEDYHARNSTQHATECRVFVSTPLGAAGCFYDIMEAPITNMEKIELRWWMHPTRKQGLYTSNNKQLQILNRNYKFPANYNYILDGKRRSPYYDRECLRPGATPLSIAQELDCDFGGSAARFFDATKIQHLKRTRAVPPFKRGQLMADLNIEPTWHENERGDFQLWTVLRHDDSPPPHDYVIGCDIGGGVAGEYTSNSVICIFDRWTGQQVGELATTDIPPERFADLAVAACKWCHEAYLVYERNGTPGAQFGARVEQLRYGNVYMRKVEELRYSKRTSKAGWWSGERTKPALLSNFRRCLDSGQFVPRSANLLQECLQYAWKDGKVVHQRADVTENPAAKGAAHGDRVIAAALALEGHLDRPVVAPDPIELRGPPPAGSMAERFQRERELQEASVDDFTW
jgi:hypothetical protein